MTNHLLLLFMFLLDFGGDQVMKTFHTSLIISIFFAAFNLTVAQPQQVYHDGETLTYKVKWSLVRLGTIRITCHQDTATGNKNLFRLTMLVQSSPFLPFINIEETNETLVNIADGMSQSFLGKHRNGSEKVNIECIYTRQRKEAVFSVMNAETEDFTRFELIRNAEPYLDGPSLFFFCRKYIHSNRIFKMPTLIDGKIESTVLDFTGPTEFIEIDAIDYPVRAKMYTGTANWQGGTAAGLGGEFKGWISDDSEAITLKAEMKVLLGSLIIELEEYNRNHWLPPVLSQNQ